MRRQRALVFLALAALFLPEIVFAAKGDNGGQALLRRRARSRAAKVSTNHYAQLDKPSYDRMRDNTVDFMRQYNPRKHYFLGVGRSPAEFAAFLKAMGDNLACQIPASSMKSMPSSSRDKEFFRHFDKLIPAGVLRSGRTFVMFDLVSTGASLRNTANMVEKYIKHKGAKNKVITVGDSAGHSGNVDAVYNFIFNVAGGQSITQFSGGESDGSHRIGTSRGRWEDLTPNTYHDLYIKQAQAHMAGDRVLDRILAKEFAQVTEARKEVKLPKGSRGEKWKIGSVYVAGLTAPGKGPIIKKMRRTVKKKKTYHDLLDEAEYIAYRDATKELMKGNDPADHVFVGVGRSATPLLALLENLEPKRVGYLPIDNAKRLTTKQKADLDQLFAEFLPKLSGGKNVVLFQKDDGGVHLAKVQSALRTYLKAQGSAAKVTAVAISSKATAGGVDRIDSSKSKPLQDLDGETIKVVAPYSRHYVGHHAPLTKKDLRDKFDIYKGAMLERMEPDKNLHDFLAVASGN